LNIYQNYVEIFITFIPNLKTLKKFKKTLYNFIVMKYNKDNNLNRGAEK
jgi:hypothetical protein